MRRFLFLLALALPMCAQKPAKPPVVVQEPPEEDADLKDKVYTFNPLQAASELKTGDYYFKKKSYRAAALRFREATKWNPGLPEAWLRLAETEEKRGEKKAAREAWAQYLELVPDAKNAAEIRKKIGKK